jgi:hypothetical protein
MIFRADEPLDRFTVGEQAARRFACTAMSAAARRGRRRLTRCFGRDSGTRTR